MTNNVYENDTYKVCIGKSKHENPELDCYQIINKITGVNEAETTILPQAINYAKQFQSSIEELYKSEERIKVPKIELAVH